MAIWDRQVESKVNEIKQQNEKMLLLILRDYTPCATNGKKIKARFSNSRQSKIQ